MDKWRSHDNHFRAIFLVQFTPMTVLHELCEHSTDKKSDYRIHPGTELSDGEYKITGSHLKFDVRQSKVSFEKSAVCEQCFLQGQVVSINVCCDHKQIFKITKIINTSQKKGSWAVFKAQQGRIQFKASALLPSEDVYSFVGTSFYYPKNPTIKNNGDKFLNKIQKCLVQTDVLSNFQRCNHKNKTSVCRDICKYLSETFPSVSAKFRNGICRDERFLLDKIKQDPFCLIYRKKEYPISSGCRTTLPYEFQKAFEEFRNELEKDYLVRSFDVCCQLFQGYKKMGFTKEDLQRKATEISLAIILNGHEDKNTKCSGSSIVRYDSLKTVMVRILPNGEPLTSDRVSCNESHWYLNVIRTYEKTLAKYLQLYRIKNREYFEPIFVRTDTCPHKLNNVQHQILNNVGIGRNGLHIITGGPGTGKTTICALMACNIARYDRVHVMAPSGIAAERLFKEIMSLSETSNTSNVSRSTMHRYIFSSHSCFNKPVEAHTRAMMADMIIIDETSMASLILLTHCLHTAIMNGVKTIVLVGDPKQLPSIQHGAILRDILSVVSSYHLTEITRQAETSSIVRNAHKISMGQSNFEIVPGVFEVFKANCPSEVEIMGKSILTKMLIDYPNNTVQVITGSNESVKVFNTEAQNIYNSDGKSSEYKRISNKYCEKYQFRSGDPVIFLNNRYIDTEPKYLNGEGGTIVVNNPNVFVETFDKKCHN